MMIGVPTNEKQKLNSNIPTVMLSSTDGAFVNDATDYLLKKGIIVTVNLDVVGLPALFDTPLMGYSGHPNVRMSEKVIHVHGLGLWSVLLTLTLENQWQLYIVPSSELSKVTPWNVETSRGQPFCTNSDFSVDPAKSYVQLIKEKCPSYLIVEDSTVKIKK